MVNPKQFNANYRKNERLLEQDPTSINVGLSKDVKDYVDSQTGSELPEHTSADAGKVLKVDAQNELQWATDEQGHAQVQSNWNETDDTQPSYIQNKPTIPDVSGKMDTNFSNASVGSATAGQVLAVNSSANGVEFATPSKELPTIATGDAGKVLAVNSGETGVEWQSIVAGGGYEFVESIEASSRVNPNSAGAYSYTVNSNYDYIIITKQKNAYGFVLNDNISNVTSVSIMYMNKYDSAVEVGFTGYVYRRPKVKTSNRISVIGCIGPNNLFIPNGGTSGQVFKKTSSDYGKGSWQDIKEVPAISSGDAGKVLTVNAGETAVEWATPSAPVVTEHTYSKWGEFVTDIINHPTARIINSGTIILITDITANSVSFSMVTQGIISNGTNALNIYKPVSTATVQKTNNSGSVDFSTPINTITYDSTTNEFTVTSTTASTTVYVINIKLIY